MPLYGSATIGRCIIMFGLIRQPPEIGKSSTSLGLACEDTCK